MLDFDAHAGFVYDVTDTDCWEQNGSTHGRAFAISERKCLTNGSSSREKNHTVQFDCQVLIQLL